MRIGRRRAPIGGLGWLLAAVAALPLVGVGAGAARAADLDEAEALFRAGRYEECAEMAAEEV